MKESVQIFNSPQFGEIRTAGTPEEPLFCLADVCKALELTSTKVAQRLTDDVLSKHPIPDNLGRTQQAHFVTEDGLYDVILDSRKPEARAFRKWITGEVLPSIRRMGGYMLSTSDMTDEEIMAHVFRKRITPDFYYSRWKGADRRAIKKVCPTFLLFIASGIAFLAVALFGKVFLVYIFMSFFLYMAYRCLGTYLRTYDEELKKLKDDE